MPLRRQAGLYCPRVCEVTRVSEATPYTQGMGKKRRVWWIVVGFVLFMLAFGIVGSMVESQGERLHREVRSVVRDYGFIELDEGMAGYYHVSGLDEGDFDKISDRLDSACNGCRSSHAGSGRRWSSPDSGRLALSVTVSSGPRDKSVLRAVSMQTNSLWDRLRSWWPW